jgi:hypothetical protein
MVTHPAMALMYELIGHAMSPTHARKGGGFHRLSLPCRSDYDSDFERNAVA